MKVVLFCGGRGTRLRDYSEVVPKPMVHIGERPILWYIMKYYSYFGHKDFILCLGHKGAAIKKFFLEYDEWISNDFTLTSGRGDLRLLNRDIDDWNLTFVDTGLNASIGERLKAVASYLDGEEVFLANYADVLTDLWLPDFIEAFLGSGKVAGFLAVNSPQSFHIARVAADSTVEEIRPIGEFDHWINGGFFVLNRRIFEYMQAGEDLVAEPFQRLIEKRELIAHRHRGFWRPMDTFKDKQALDDLFEAGMAPWELWKIFPPYSPGTDVRKFRTDGG
jgi:glucose-1-phosphate cytidylyltransferase